MNAVWEGLITAWRLLISGDPEMLRVTLFTIEVSGTATLVSIIIGVPLGLILAQTGFRGHRAAVSLVNTGMGLPPTVVG
ncbi:MAG: ABC transporter permease, partial [Bacillota bacterium]